MEYLPTLISALFGGLVSIFVGYTVHKIKKYEEKREQDMEVANKERTALRKGVQNLLRSRLYVIYRRCKKQGYIRSYDMEEFQSCYDEYKSLGGNGAMEEVREKFYNLPINGDEGE